MSHGRLVKLSASLITRSLLRSSSIRRSSHAATGRVFPISVVDRRRVGGGKDRKIVAKRKEVTVQDKTHSAERTTAASSTDNPWPADKNARLFLRALFEGQSDAAPSSSAPNPSTYASLKLASPILFARLTHASFVQLFLFFVKSDLEPIARQLLADLRPRSRTSPFSAVQKRWGLRALATAWSRRDVAFPRHYDFASSGILNNQSIVDAFIALRSTSKVIARLGLTPVEASSILGCLVRTRHPLLWDAPCVTGLWEAAEKHIAPVRRKDRTRGGGVNTHVGYGLLVAWLEGGLKLDDAAEAASSSPVSAVALRVFGDLCRWGFLASDETFEPTFDRLPPTDRTTLTVLGTLCRAGARQARRFAPKILDDSYSDHAARRPLRIVERHARHEREQGLEAGPFSISYRLLAEEVIRQYLPAEGARVRAAGRLRARGSPANAAVKLLLSLDAVPPPSREADADLSGFVLDWLVQLGHGSLLIMTYLALIRQGRPRAPGWSLPRVLASLQSLAASPDLLAQGVGEGSFIAAPSVGKPLMSRERLVRLVLVELMAADGIREQTDVRMQDVRRQAFRIAVEHPSPFPWSAFLTKEGVDPTGKGTGAFMVEMLAELWRLGWVDSRPGTRNPVPLRLLVSTIAFASASAPPELKTAQRDLLRSVVRLFVADRTPHYDPSTSPYFTVPEPVLTHADLTALIRAHLTIGGDLALKFATEGFARMEKERWVPTGAEDLAMLWTVLERLEGAGGTASTEAWWAEMAVRPGALPVDAWAVGKASERVVERVKALRAAREQAGS